MLFWDNVCLVFLKSKSGEQLAETKIFLVVVVPRYKVRFHLR